MTDPKAEPLCSALRGIRRRRRVRVKAPSRMYSSPIPDDAKPGDIVTGNRGAQARVCEGNSGNPLHRTLYLEFIPR